MADAITDAYHAVFGGEPNLSMTERGVSVLLGLGLAAAGAQPRPNPLLNVLALAGGAYLALRGASGRCPVKAALSGPSGDRGRIGERTAAPSLPAGERVRAPAP